MRFMVGDLELNFAVDMMGIGRLMLSGEGISGVEGEREEGLGFSFIEKLGGW